MDEEEIKDDKPEVTPEIIPEKIPDPVVEEPTPVEVDVPEAEVKPEEQKVPGTYQVPIPEEVTLEIKPDPHTQGSGEAKEEKEIRHEEPKRETRSIIEIKSFRDKALAAIFKKRQARLEKIMRLAMDAKKKGKSITNNDIELLVHVSDATATRYLEKLTRMGMLKKSGKRAGTTYSAP